MSRPKGSLELRGARLHRPAGDVEVADAEEWARAIWHDRQMEAAAALRARGDPAAVVALLIDLQDHYAGFSIAPELAAALADFLEGRIKAKTGPKRPLVLRDEWRQILRETVLTQTTTAKSRGEQKYQGQSHRDNVIGRLAKHFGIKPATLEKHLKKRWKKRKRF